MLSSIISPLQTIEMLNVEGIRHSLAYMPECSYQDFSLWILSHPDLAHEWLQLVGMTSLSRLTVGMVDNLLTNAEIEALMPYTVPVNVFNMYEIIADNLAIGLAYPAVHDTTYVKRRQIFTALNSAMVARLRGADQDAIIDALARQPAIHEISLFDQSLSANKHRTFAAAFTEECPGIDLKALEYALYPNLVANIEVCYQVVENLNDCLTKELVQKGFVRRYAGLNRLLDDSYIPRDYLVQIGMNTSMVRPLLGYYIAIIAEKIRPVHNYEDICENGFLLRALEDAALLCRLLNDVGPHLLEQSREEHQELINQIRHVQERERFRSFHDLLLHVSGKSDIALSRLKKDLKFREVNLALYQPCRSRTVDEAIEVFHEQLTYLSHLYHRHSARMTSTLEIISFESQSNIIADVVLRFVKFQKQLYAASFEHSEGEYAI